MFKGVCDLCQMQNCAGSNLLELQVLAFFSSHASPPSLALSRPRLPLLSQAPLMAHYSQTEAIEDCDDWMMS